MKSIKGDIWDFHAKGHTVCILTNCSTDRNGNAVMGAGTALQAKQRFPELPKEYGEQLQEFKFHVLLMGKQNLFMFPTKIKVWENSDLNTIRKSCKELRMTLKGISRTDGSPVYLPFPGIGYGGLKKEDVLPILEEEFKDCDDVILVEYEKTFTN